MTLPNEKAVWPKANRFSANMRPSFPTFAGAGERGGEGVSVVRHRYQRVNLEFVFSASPETNRREPLELSPALRPVRAGPGSLRAE
jgi:hypothetical protein